MKANVFKILIVIMAAVLLVFSSACGEKSTAAPQPVATLTKAAPVPVQTEEATAESPSGQVTSLKDVKKAVIQIEAEGSFMDPQLGQVTNGAGRGSGFIIDPSGIAVTNNHVVTGAGLLKVWVGGDQSKTYNAKVLGVSECSDLAVIDIEGEGFPYISWYEGPIEVGTDIYVAGFPLGDPEFSLTKGIISKAKANGETPWASVESVIEYDATTNPGNSGGPVITQDGQVVAVHYAGNAQTRQAFGISRDVAKAIIAQLEAGQNLDWIGVNGQAVSNEDGSITGVWVSSVQSGSPADKSGLEAGDIITKVENLTLASDGTMADYCNILRSHKSSDTLNMEVLRWQTSEVLEGQLNGRELAVVSTGSTGDSGDTGSTPTSSPLGNPNATNPGDLFFSTEFDDVQNWFTLSVPKSDDFQAVADNGTLYIQVNPEQVTVYALYDMVIVPSDVRIDTKAQKVVGPNTNNISLVCRATDAGWYEFSMTSGGYWYIWLYFDGEYTQLAKGATTAINLKNQSNEVTATCIGKELTFYINGVKVGAVTDRTFSDGGKVGVSVYSEYPGVGVEFDWFTASVP